MENPKIQAFSKFYNPVQNPRMYFLLVAGIFLTTVQYFITKDILSTVSVGSSFAILYWILSKPKLIFDMELGLDKIIYSYSNKEKTGKSKEKYTSEIIVQSIDWNNCLSWSMVDLGDMIEICVETNNWRQRFYYFYIHPDYSFGKGFELEDIIIYISQNIEYDEKNITRDWIHQMLRKLGLE